MNQILGLPMIDPAVSISRYRERPRISLETGAILAQSVHLAPPLADPAALDLACGLARTTGVMVSVPLTGSLATLPNLVETALRRAGVAPHRLEIALSAPALEHRAVESLLALSALRDLGIEIALADFGGPGTLDLIQHLPLSTVILRPALIRDLPGSAAAAAMLHQVLRIARDHGLPVVATGIESEPQRALLSGLGCTAGEGILFGHPALQLEPTG